MKFKYGDKVVVTDGFYAGQTGTVKEISEYKTGLLSSFGLGEYGYYIKFDNESIHISRITESYLQIFGCDQGCACGL